MHVSDAEGRLRALLRDAGLDLNQLDPGQTWEVFKTFAKEKVEGTGPHADDDLVLFESGVYDWYDGKGSRFQWSLVRQFALYEQRGIRPHGAVALRSGHGPGSVSFAGPLFAVLAGQILKRASDDTPSFSGASVQGWRSLVVPGEGVKTRPDSASPAGPRSGGLPCEPGWGGRDSNSRLAIQSRACSASTQPPHPGSRAGSGSIGEGDGLSVYLASGCIRRPRGRCPIGWGKVPPVNKRPRDARSGYVH